MHPLADMAMLQGPDALRGDNDGLRSRRCRACIGAGIALVLLLHGAAARAAEFGWSVGGAVEYSDNPARVSEEEMEETSQATFGTLSLRKHSSSVKADLKGSFEHNEYVSDVVSDHTEFMLDGTLEWDMVDDTLTWFVRDTYRQIPRDTRAVVTPESEQDANAFVTGPDITWQLSDAMYTRLSPRYGHFWFEDTDEDHTRHRVVATLGRRVSPVTDVSVNVGGERVHFTQETATQRDYTRRDAYLGYRRRLPHGELEASLGHARIQRDVLDDLDVDLFGLRAVTAVSARVRVGMDLSTGTTDLGEKLLIEPDDPLGTNPFAISVTGEVGRERRAALFTEYRSGPLTTSVMAGAGEEDYDTDALDRDTVGGSLRIEYELNPLTSVSFMARRLRSEFPELDGRDRDRATGIGLTRRLGRSLELRVAAEHQERRSTLPESSYEENLARLELRYVGRRMPERSSPRSPRGTEQREQGR